MNTASDPATLRGNPHEQRRIIHEAQHAILSAVDPRKAIYRLAKRSGHELAIDTYKIDLDSVERIFVVAIGKAAVPMIKALIDLLDNTTFIGIIVTKHDHAVDFDAPELLEVIEAGHPVPDRHSIKAARAIESLLSSATNRDLIICAISGGGSALVTLPVDGVSLHDMQSMTDLLLRCGATIYELNTVRKHLDRIKGGGMAKWTRGAKTICLLLSDVIGDDLAVIASGMTVPDPSSFEDAKQVIEVYNLATKLPSPIIRYIEAGCRGDVPDTPKSDESLFQDVHNIIVGSNRLAVEAAEKYVRSLGFNTLLLSTFIQGEAREIAKVATAIAHEIDVNARPLRRPACVIWGGETTVTVRGNGTGGRNQELALAAAIGLDRLDDTWLLALGTDGSDGPTDAAGAIVSGDSVSRAKRCLPRSASSYLADNDAYTFFSLLSECEDSYDDLILTGPTGSNVNDVMLLCLF